jgi:hypothetical protein
LDLIFLLRILLSFCVFSSLYVVYYFRIDISCFCSIVFTFALFMVLHHFFLRSCHGFLPLTIFLISHYYNLPFHYCFLLSCYFPLHCFRCLHIVFFFHFQLVFTFKFFLLLSTFISHLCTTFVTSTKTIKISDKRIGLSLNLKYKTKGLKQK